ncbi:MAG TPA: molecular chaperone TorD family protein [Symbiobacteriaceae bacterium]|jgi:putative dimethyl sulfoxide reductase chaperone|nr:molecular chaperone TorD family protein [Symbiobacteriaceae bacterium]
MADDLTLPFEVRSQVYRLLADLFLTPPDEQVLTMLSHPDFVADWPLGRGLPDVEQGLTRIANALPQANLTDLRQEFYHLFGFLGPADAPPWQSVYLDREHVLMGEETLKLRALFARFGLVVAETERQPEDHISLQLQFLAALAARTAERLTAGDEPGARTLLEGQRECLEENLLRWADKFVSQAEAASESGFYGGLARLTLGLLRLDLSEVRRLLAAPSLI